MIVVEDGTRTTQLVMPFERPPYEGDVVELPDGLQVTVRHVISATRDGLAGVVLAWVADAVARAPVWRGAGFGSDPGAGPHEVFRPRPTSFVLARCRSNSLWQGAWHGIALGPTKLLKQPLADGVFKTCAV